MITCCVYLFTQLFIAFLISIYLIPLTHELLKAKVPKRVNKWQDEYNL